MMSAQDGSPKTNRSLHSVRTKDLGRDPKSGYAELSMQGACPGRLLPFKRRWDAKCNNDCWDENCTTGAIRLVSGRP